ncbi:non-ribosomal peptide synthetase [Xenorhabdus griffiniae]|uniref:non-ribosomal peptide synthetase n=1 Tax=Xenorhabdus griffiniae TaxID=351672 RepID=UPI002359F9F9|nr:non-ribosomal peptide synthetase [Xenorhabdus griffiniae]MDC9605740.1 non-ribosomal peptide synthetase [Xenorhabdus griffiniae]
MKFKTYKNYFRLCANINDKYSLFVRLMTHVASGLKAISKVNNITVAYALNSGKKEKSINFSVVHHKVQYFSDISEASFDKAYSKNQKIMLEMMSSAPLAEPMDIDFFIGYETCRLLEGIRKHSLLPNHGQHKFTIYFQQKPQRLELTLCVDMIYFNEAQIAQFLQKISHSLSVAQIAEHISIIDGPYLSQTYVTESIATHLFYYAFKQFSERTALCNRQISLSYQQLYQRACTLSVYLNTLHDQNFKTIAIGCSQKIYIITAILTAIQLGKPFVIIESNDHNQRREHILSSVAHPLIVNDDLIIAALANPIEQSTQEIIISTSPDDILCYTFTSGTTGQPKGIAIKHISLLNVILSRHQLVNITSQDTLLHNISFTFDPALWQLFGALCFGARLILQEDTEMLDPLLTFELMERYKVTITDFVPSVLSKLMTTLSPDTCLKSLRVLYVGGEVFTLALYNMIKRVCTARIFNQYGPSECTIDSLAYEILGQDEKERIAIGSPIPNCQVMVVGDNDEPTKQGEIGELVISGINVSSGYLDHDLNVIRFFEYDGTLFYRSGDLCVLDDYGIIHFIGRKDRQIKINGVRIELEEIESRVMSLAFIDAVFAVFQQGVLSLYIKSQYTEIDKHKTEAIRSVLPRYALNAKIFSLSHVPLNQTGKLDISRLSECIYKNKTNTEISKFHDEESALQIAKYLFCRLLQRDDINPNDNFFMLGGNSLQVIDIILEIKSSEGIEIEVQSFVQLPTPKHLATLIQAAKQSHLLPQKLPLSHEMNLLAQEKSLSSREHRLFFTITSQCDEKELMLQKIKKLANQTSIFKYHLRKEDNTIGLVYNGIVSMLINPKGDFIEFTNEELDSSWRTSKELPLFSIINNEEEHKHIHIYIHRALFDGFTANLLNNVITQTTFTLSDGYVNYILKTNEPEIVENYRESASIFVNNFRKILDKKTVENVIQISEVLKTPGNLREVLSALWHRHSQKPLYIGILTANRHHTTDMTSIGRYVNIVPAMITCLSDINAIMQYVSAWTIPYYYVQQMIVNEYGHHIPFDFLINQEIQSNDNHRWVTSHSMPQQLGHLSKVIITI